MIAADSRTTCARKPLQDASGIVRRLRRQPCVSDRLDDKNDHHEQRQDQRHGVEPPECRIGELGPEVEAPSHPNPCGARERDRPPHLRREAPFDRFEERPALPSVKHINHHPNSLPLTHFRDLLSLARNRSAYTMFKYNSIAKVR